MNRIILLYECSGMAALPLAEAEFEVYCYDKENSDRDEGNIHYRYWDAVEPFENLMQEHVGQVRFVFGFPPCTDLAVSGAKHFPSKRRANPDFQKEAMDLVMRVPQIAEYLDAPYALENPISRIATLWRKPDFYFEPYQYGGYLPEDDVHPLFPQYIEPRDAYSKNTSLWTSPSVKLPSKKIVPVKPGWSKQTTKLGGKSARTKFIRSMSPRGFFTALALHLKNT